MFHKSIDQPSLAEEIKQWYLSFAEEKNAEIPLLDFSPQKLAEVFAEELYLFWRSMNNILTQQENFPFTLELTGKPIVKKDMKIVQYGTIAYEGNIIPFAESFRVKKSKHLDSKVQDFHQKGKNHIYDLFGMRIIIGETERTEYRQPLQESFLAKSTYLDSLLKEITGNENSMYAGTDEDKKFLREHSEQLRKAWVFFRNAFQKGEGTKVAKHLQLETGMMDTWLQAGMEQYLSNHPSLKITSTTDYITHPKENGFNASHIAVIPKDKQGEKEIHLRTGFQHVFASRYDLASQWSHILSAKRPEPKGIIPNYSAFLPEALNKAFRHLT